MYSAYILLTIILIALVFGIIEFRNHQKRIHSIPIRIHVNGTRGKSSVTRLIGAGLREGEIATITKVTGTFPRLIIENGDETFIYRKSGANILEQLAIVKFASQRKVKALVMECMALQPQYQSITEKQMIHSNISVITNVRLDHVDIMGYTLPEIASVLGKTIPRNGLFFSAENIIPDSLKKIADKRNTASTFVNGASVTTEEMKGFSYIEHKENVALALAICEHLKIDRKVALQGMYKAVPDAGVLKCSRVYAFQKQVVFFNAFAANDPDSSYMIWKLIRDEFGFEGSRIILLNTRHDRLDRARQLAELSGKLNSEMDYLILMGQSTEVVENMAIGYGVAKNKIINVGWTEPQIIFENILSVTNNACTIVAIGNMGGKGAETAEFFEHRHLKKI